MKRETLVSGAGPRPPRPGGPESGFVPAFKRPLRELQVAPGRIAVESDTVVSLPGNNLPPSHNHALSDLLVTVQLPEAAEEV